MNIACISGFLSKNIDLINVSEDKVLAKFQLVVKCGVERDYIDFICWDNVALYLYQNARKGFEISVIGQVRTITEKDKTGLYLKKTIIVASSITIHTARYDNALSIDEFVARYAPEQIAKKMKTVKEATLETEPSDDEIKVIFKEE